MADDYNDLHRFDTMLLTWSEIDTSKGTVPAPRDSMFFAEAGGKLFVYSGYSVALEGDKPVAIG